MLHVTEQQRAAAVLEQLRNLLGTKCSIKRNSCVSARDDAQIDRDPTRMIVGEYGDAGSPREVLFREPAADRLGHPTKFGVGVTFHPVVALDFESDVIRPALRALAKTVVESGHGSRGILHETDGRESTGPVKPTPRRRVHRDSAEIVVEAPATYLLPAHLIC